MQSLWSIPAHEAEGLESLLNLSFCGKQYVQKEHDFEAYQKQKVPYALSTGQSAVSSDSQHWFEFNFQFTLDHISL